MHTVATLATREEYAVQRYEGASTHFGPNQLVATCQQFEVLATVMYHSCEKKPGQKLLANSGLPPPSIKGMGVFDYNISVIHDGVVSGASFGSVVDGADAMTEYRWGSTVKIRFHAAHPKNNLRIQGTFLEVQRWMIDTSRKSKGIWVIFADDGDTNTTFSWERQGTFRSVVTIEWLIPETTSSGKYRMKVNGDCKHVLWQTVTPYSGVSSTFQVVGPGAPA